MVRYRLRVDCAACEAFQEYEHVRRTENALLVDCAVCGKRHSADSVYPVDPTHEYSRDAAGNVTEVVP